METNWRITYRNTDYYFAEAEDAFRYFLTFYNRRDAKTASIEMLNGKTGLWETVKF